MQISSILFYFNMFVFLFCINELVELYKLKRKNKIILKPNSTLLFLLILLSFIFVVISNIDVDNFGKTVRILFEIIAFVCSLSAIGYFADVIVYDQTDCYVGWSIFKRKIFYDDIKIDKNYVDLYIVTSKGKKSLNSFNRDEVKKFINTINQYQLKNNNHEVIIEDRVRIEQKYSILDIYKGNIRHPLLHISMYLFFLGLLLVGILVGIYECKIDYELKDLTKIEGAVEEYTIFKSSYQINFVEYENVFNLNRNVIMSHEDLIRKMDEKELLLVYAKREFSFEGLLENQYKIYHIESNEGVILSIETMNLYDNDVANFLCGFSLFGCLLLVICMYFDIKIGRNPEKYSKSVKRIFFSTRSGPNQLPELDEYDWDSIK